MEVSITLSNDGNINAQEVVQLYIRDKAGRITRPVRALKGFQKVKLDAGEQEQVTFTLHYDDFKYYDNNGIWDVEAGEIEIYVGSNSTTKNKIKLILE